MNLKRKSLEPIPNANTNLKSMLKSKTNGFFKKINGTGSQNAQGFGRNYKNSSDQANNFSRTSAQGFKIIQHSPTNALADGKNSQSAKALLPLKAIKLHGPAKPAVKIKPPLPNKLKGRLAGASSVEDILKLADEGIANIDQELTSKRPNDQQEGTKTGMASQQ